MTSKQILALLQSREELLKQLNEVNTQIIRLTLDHGADTAIGIAQRGGRGGARGSNASAAAKGGARRKWFERGEMLKLAKKLLNQPMAQADLVRALSSAKGYDKGLPASEKARFKSAAYQAIAAALNGKQLVRNKLGQVAVHR
jgi:hypothetical protein